MYDFLTKKEGKGMILPIVELTHVDYFLPKESGSITMMNKVPSGSKNGLQKMAKISVSKQAHIQEKKQKVAFMCLKTLTATSLFLALSIFSVSCSGGVTHPHHKKGGSPQVVGIGQSSVDQRSSLGLSPEARAAHEAVMHEHFEAIYQIVAALALEEFDKAQEITERQLGFAKHREAMQRQKPESFPPEYHDLAMAHHRAAENLAHAILSHKLKLIFTHLEQTLHTCVACHRVYKT